MTQCISLLTVLVFTLFTHGFIGDYKLCYECFRVPSPRDCDRVVQCFGNNSVCFVEQVVSHNGVVLYNMGCRQVTRCHDNTRPRQISDMKSKYLYGELTYNVTSDPAIADSEDTDLAVCEECCHGDFCNSYGCNSKPLPPLNQRGPVCFDCHQQTGEDTCDQLTVCDQGQLCFMAPYHTGTNERLFTTGCMEKSTCIGTPELAIGRRDAILCTGCCADDYCNRNCSMLNYHLNGELTSPPTWLSSTSSTTATSIMSTARSTSPVSTQPPLTTPKYIAINREFCQLFMYTYNEQYNKCYKVYNDKYKDMLPWKQARNRCKQDGGDLIVFDGLAEELFFAVLEEKLNHLDLPRFWVGATNLNGANTWQWLDGRAVNYSYFHPGEPNDSHELGEHCAALAQFVVHGSIAMNDDICEVKTNFICEISTRALQSTVPPVQHESQCRNHDYTYLPAIGMCFKIYSDVMKSQSEARATCKNEHGDLLVLRNMTVEHVFQEMHFYSQDETLRYWLGGERIPGHTANRFDSFRWLNGHTMDPGLQWFTGEPNNYQNQEDCLTFTYFNNKNTEFALNDADCSKKYFFICEEKCPDRSYQYLPTFDLCIKVYNKRVTWPEARARCAQDKTDLFEPENLKTLQFLEMYLNFTRNAGDGPYWVGAKDDAQHSHYEWLTSSNVVPAEFWHHGEPNWSNGKENCAALHRFSADNKLLMNDLSCHTNISFICQHIW